VRVPRKREKAPSCDEDHELILKAERKLLERIAELAAKVSPKKEPSGYQKGLKPSEELVQCLLDLEILRARHV
jgi:hypothetical protein